MSVESFRRFPQGVGTFDSSMHELVRTKVVGLRHADVATGVNISHKPRAFLHSHSQLEGTMRKAQITRHKHKAQSTKHKAQSKKHRA
jgi:hypothetical protein